MSLETENLYIELVEARDQIDQLNKDALADNTRIIKLENKNKKLKEALFIAQKFVNYDYKGDAVKYATHVEYEDDGGHHTFSYDPPISGVTTKESMRIPGAKKIIEDSLKDD